MLQEGDQGGSYRDHLHRRKLDVIDLLRGHLLKVLAIAHGHQICGDVAIGIGGHVARGYAALILEISRNVDGITGLMDDALFHPPERRLDEAVLIDSGVGSQGANQACIWSFRCLDRADAPVVGRVDVANRKAGPFAGQTAWAQGADPALVG